MKSTWVVPVAIKQTLHVELRGSLTEQAAIEIATSRIAHQGVIAGDPVDEPSPCGASRPIRVVSDEDRQLIINTIKRLVRPRATEDRDTFTDSIRWRSRGSSHANGAVLVVEHDGGEYAPFFNWDYGQRKCVEDMRIALEQIGCYPEGQSCLITGIYLLENVKVNKNDDDSASE